MSTKGRDGDLKEKRGRSPSLSLGQQRRSPTPSPTPSVLDRKKGSVLTESRRVSGLPKKQPLDKTKPPRSSPPSKVTSTRSKPNEKNVTRLSTKITGSTKPKDVVNSRPPLRSKNVVNVKETTNASDKKQIKKGLENVVPEKNRIVSDVHRSSKPDIVNVTHEDDNKTIPVFNEIRTPDCDKQILDDVDGDTLNSAVEIETPLRDPIDLSRNQDMPESEIRSRDNATIDRSVDREHTNDHDNEIIVQDQKNETSEVASNRLLVPDPPEIVVDQENEGPEIERVAQDSYVGSKNVEHIDSNDQDPKEPQHEEMEPQEPKEEKIEPKEPEVEETEVQEEPEIQETEIPEIVSDHEETEAPEEPENQETENPEELPDHEEPEEVKHEEMEGKEVEKEELGSKMVVLKKKKKEVVAHGKKEMGIAYNDVIEETVSKLRRQRKNRVLALVGAFETVISLESDENDYLLTSHHH